MTHRVHRADGDRRDRPPVISAPPRYRAPRVAATPAGHIGRFVGASGRAG